MNLKNRATLKDKSQNIKPDLLTLNVFQTFKLDTTKKGETGLCKIETNKRQNHRAFKIIDTLAT